MTPCYGALEIVGAITIPITIAWYHSNPTLTVLHCNEAPSQSYGVLLAI